MTLQELLEEIKNINDLTSQSKFQELKRIVLQLNNNIPEVSEVFREAQEKGLL